MTQHAELLPRYKRLRQVGLELNTQLVKTLPRSVIDEGGKKLGLLKKNVLVLDTEDEISLLMDYCLYDVRHQGVNGIERYLTESPPPEGSDERVLLEAARQAWYSLFVVEKVEPGVGVQVHDMLRDESIFLIDVGLSISAPIGMIVAMRVMVGDGITMTTGAPLPVGLLPPAERSRFLDRIKTLFQGTDFHHLSPKDASELAATVIRDCLKRGAAERVQYVEPRRQGRPASGSAAPPPRRAVGRNDRCPCGSGKKYKNCCGAAR